MERAYHAGVVGAGACSEERYRLARALGREIGERGWILFCGGLGGVMEAAARGCSEAGGITVGLIPGLDKHAANPYIQIPVPTGLGEGRNLLVVRTSDIIIAVAGGYGTLSEISLALKTGKPVVGLETWQDLSGVHYARDPMEAVRRAEQLLQAP